MFGRYPLEERWRVILTAILFVALLVPLMIPQVPYKALNAIVFFGVFPIVGFMLLVGAALPFGLVGLVALIVNFVIWLVGALLGFIVMHPLPHSARPSPRPAASSGCRTNLATLSMYWPCYLSAPATMSNGRSPMFRPPPRTGARQPRAGSAARFVRSGSISPFPPPRFWASWR